MYLTAGCCVVIVFYNHYICVSKNSDSLRKQVLLLCCCRLYIHFSHVSFYRMCLDDNHNSVVLACAKAIQCALSCQMNEIIFDTFEVELKVLLFSTNKLVTFQHKNHIPIFFFPAENTNFFEGCLYFSYI